ncbi:MAG: hypothetical protein NC120_08150 [Ruminococcus sp.]|nr:hypothetical protein [Ruminococcus sp.]
MTDSYNPLMEINTSFNDYLVERTRSYQEHVVGGTLDYAFDADFAMRQKIGGFSGWSRLYKAIVSTDIPNRFKRYFQSSDSANSMQYSKAYEAAKKCSERLQISIPVILVRKAGETPEIMSMAGEGIEPCIVMTADIAEGFTEDELCYLMGCECGRIQNRHSAFNYAFTYPGISRGDVSGTNGDNVKSNIRELNYSLNKWLISGDITADRAGIICLDDPASFCEIFASVRKKGIPDSFGNVNRDIDIDGITKHYETLHITPVRDLKMGGEYSADERRIVAGMEFIGCEILYIWRPDLERPQTHIGNKQALEIRCDIIANADSSHSA